MKLNIKSSFSLKIYFSKLEREKSQKKMNYQYIEEYVVVRTFYKKKKQAFKLLPIFHSNATQNGLYG